MYRPATISTLALALALTAAGASASPAAPASAQLLIGPLLAPLSGPPHAAAPVRADDRESLEAFLERMRQAREQRYEANREYVAEQMKKLEESSKSPTGSARARKSLIELGPELAPLIAPFLDPGEAASRGELYRATQVVEVLRSLASPVTTSELLDQARRGSTTGRRNAILALAAAPAEDHERVLENLNEVYRGGESELRTAALGVLAQLGGASAEKLFVEALADSDDELVSAALVALTDARKESSAPQVLALSRGKQGATHALEILSFYLAVQDVVEEEHVAELLKLAAGPRLADKNREAMLDRLRSLDFSMQRDVEEAIAPLLDSPSPEVRGAARVLAAAKGDRGIRRELISEADDEIDRAKGSARSLAARGHLYYRLGDYRLALRDYRSSVKEWRNGQVDTEVQIGIARCFACQGRFKDAAEELNHSNVSIRTLKELGDDPDFREMALDDKYRESVFRLDPLEDED